MLRSRYAHTRSAFTLVDGPPEVVIVRSELLEGQGMPTAPSAPAQPPVAREQTGPYREPESEPGNGFEEGRGPRRDPNASNNSSRFTPRNGAPDGTPLPFRPNSIRYGQ